MHAYIYMKLISTLILIAPLTVACSSPEEQCLDSFRLELKDPDSAAVVSNLGNRGLEMEDGAFFLRYKATNSYGAYVSSNVYCRRGSESKYTREPISELTYKSKVVTKCLIDSLNQIQAGQQPLTEDCDRFAEREFYERVGILYAR